MLRKKIQSVSCFRNVLYDTKLILNQPILKVQILVSQSPPLYKAELLLLKPSHLFAREVLLLKKLEIEETKNT